MAEKKDYYEVLNLTKGASAAEIKQSYRRLARKYHPDVNPNDPEAENHFKEINEAYQVLSDPEKKESYDRFGYDAVNGQGGFGGFNVDFGDIDLGDIFGGFFGGQASSSRKAHSTRGNDLRYDLTITLEQAAKGIDKKLRYSHMERCDKCNGSGAKEGTQPKTCTNCGGTGQIRHQQQTIFGMQVRVGACPNCQGTGKIIEQPCEECGGQTRVRKTVEKTISIPAGIDEGMQIRITGGADAGLRGGPSGDLYVYIKIKKHPIFERNGNDLWCTQEISFACAALGGTLDIHTFDGDVPLHIAPGTQYGEVYTLKGKGMPEPSSSKVGDLNVTIKIKTPTNLKDDEKKLITDFATMRGEEIKPHKGKNIFKRVKDAFK